MNDIIKTDAQLAQPIAELSSMPVAIGLYLDDRLYERVKAIAHHMAKAQGVTPKHLIAQPEACFAVVTRAITWKLDPFAVAMSTYQTPGGRIGYEGKLVHAIVENSGRLKPDSGGIKLEYYGDWTKMRGKFAMRESKKTDSEGEARKYAAPTWTDDDAAAWGLGVKVSATLRGETSPREYSMDLVQCQPRNSTLWATDPKTQLGYAAIRRFASVAVPSLLMGVPFEGDSDLGAQPEKEIQGERVVVEQPTRRPADVLDPNLSPHTQQVDMQTGEITEEKPAPAEDQGPLEQPMPSDLISAEQRRFISIKMQRAALTDADLKTKFGFELAAAPAARVNEILKWVDSPMGG